MVKIAKFSQNLVWFGQKPEAEFKTNGLFGPNFKAKSEQWVSQWVSQRGRYRAARAAKKETIELTKSNKSMQADKQTD